MPLLFFSEFFGIVTRAGMLSRIDAEGASIDTRSGMVRALARDAALALQSVQHVAAVTAAAQEQVGEDASDESRAC